MFMKRQNIGTVALAIGALLLVLALAADIVRPGGAPGFGTSQLVVAVSGIIVLGAGMGWLIWGSNGRG